MRRRKLGKNRGIVLVAVCLFLLMLMAGLGLGVDLNRLLAARQALQSNAESAAVAAALELDGTQAGVERARTRAAYAWPAGPAMTLEFAASKAGPWDADPLAPQSLQAVRVQAESALQLTLLRGVVQRKFLPVNAVARAEQQPVDRLEYGLAPYAVTGPLAPGDIATLLPGLTAAVQPGEVRDTILGGRPGGAKIGEALTLHPSASPKVEREALREIALGDTDPGAGSFASYTGNGRRLIAVPILDAENRVTGFGGFLLLTAASYADDAPSLRAEYTGSFLLGAPHRAAAGESGAWRVEVVK